MRSLINIAAELVQLSAAGNIQELPGRLRQIAAELRDYHDATKCRFCHGTGDYEVAEHLKTNCPYCAGTRATR